MTDSSSVHRDSGQSESNTQLSPGTMLRAAREAAGLSREELSQRLCIIDNTVEWLESDLYERQPEAVYARGYIRNICRELSIDSVPVLSAYDAARPKRPTRKDSSRIEIKADALRPARKRGQGFLALLPLVAVGGVFWWLYGGPVTIPALQNSAEQSAPVAQTNQIRSVPRETSQEEPTSIDVSLAEAPELQHQAAPQPAVEAVAATEESAPSTAEITEQSIESAEQLPAEVAQLDKQLQGALLLSFDEDSWIEVKDAEGVVLLAGVQAAGSSKTLDGRAPFELMLGNAGATKVVYREQTIDSGPIGNRRTRRLIVGD
ncbi:RodZ domain-containing protein [Microbulbifer echini]|uniref:RodZ domain-containing protein n=1 Tax=Microbulbifer echini TaxID=1529067 RepID=A0ABV4NQ68_9GAMM